MLCRRKCYRLLFPYAFLPRIKSPVKLLTFLALISFATLKLTTVYNTNIISLLQSRFPRGDELPSLQQVNISTTTCKKYHVALIIATADEAREASYLLKTLMHHRRSPLHLHLLVSKVTHRIMKTLLDTWELVGVDFNLYKVVNLDDTSVNREKLKYSLAETVANITNEIVYFDNGVRLLDDVSNLWQQVESIAGNNWCLGLIPHGPCSSGQSNCFSDKIVMLHLNKFREFIAFKQLMNAKTTAEINDILSKNRRGLIASIPCDWAVIMKSDSRQSDCVKDLASVKAVVQSDVGISPTADTILEQVRAKIEAVLKSEFLAVSPSDCFNVSQNSSNETLGKTDPCAKYRRIVNLKRRTHLYYIGSPESQAKADISLLTQLTLDRFGVLERQLRNWGGRATVVFHVNDTEAMELKSRINGSKLLRDRKSISYHVVYKREAYNPINYLRNVAVNNTDSQYLFFADVDLIPNPGLYKNLDTLIRNHMHDSDKKTVLVVPAFQMFNDLGEATPINKSHLVNLMKNKTIVGYGMERGWNLGHKPTNYSKWISAEKPYQAIFADAYEPYFVVGKDFDARYNEQLLERMGDKIAYSRLLHGQGYEFLVIPEDFIIHAPHATSAGSKRYWSENDYSRCGSQFFESYRKELYEKFPNRKF